VTDASGLPECCKCRNDSYSKRSLSATPTITTNSPILSGADAIFTISGTAGDGVTYGGDATVIATREIGAGGTVAYHFSVFRCDVDS
jgi:hypothetical protein